MTDATAAEPPVTEEPFNIGETDDSLERMVALFARHGDTFRVYSPVRKAHVWVVNHPDDVKRVLVGNHRNYTKGLGFDRVRILLGTGIIASEGEFWRRQRYMMQPCFHRKVLTRFAEVIARHNDRRMRRWERLAADDELINVTDETSEMTLDIVLETIFGSDVERLVRETGDNPFLIVTREPARDLRFAYRFRGLAKVVQGILDHRRANRAEHFDYVAMLMDARDKETGEPMTDRELIDELLTLIVAGHETTASALNSTWYLLARNPAAEAKLHRELDAAPDWPAPSLTEMESLHYTHNVCDESLRMYPPGWLISRRAIEADELGGYVLPAGTDVLLSPYLLHRHPAYWHEPESFRPERFDAEHEAERPRFAYMPFAAGPRHCIGETLAMYEMLMHLYLFARRFRLELTSDAPIEFEALVNLRTLEPLRMRLVRRHPAH
jgi:cytochrome P450